MKKIDKALDLLKETKNSAIHQLRIDWMNNFGFDDCMVQEVLDIISKAYNILSSPEDIYEINTPFGLLDSETRQKLVDTFKLEYYDGTTWKILNGSPYQHSQHTIRAVKPTKPSINWDHVADKFKWLAMDEDGIYFLFAEKPEFDEEDGIWKAVWVDCIESTGFKSFIPGTCAAKDSLIERPKND